MALEPKSKKSLIFGAGVVGAFILGGGLIAWKAGVFSTENKGQTPISDESGGSQKSKGAETVDENMTFPETSPLA